LLEVYLLLPSSRLIQLCRRSMRAKCSGTVRIQCRIFLKGAISLNFEDRKVASSVNVDYAQNKLTYRIEPIARSFLVGGKKGIQLNKNLRETESGALRKSLVAQKVVELNISLTQARSSTVQFLVIKFGCP
jgi:hypothetical protein